MWDSILNYSVYTVSCHGNGQSITDGGQSASTQQVKEVSKVKQSSKGHTGGGGHFCQGCLCHGQAINSLIIFLSHANRPVMSSRCLPSTYRARSMKPKTPRSESLLKDVKDGTTSQSGRCSCCHFWNEHVVPCLQLLKKQKNKKQNMFELI